MKRRRNLPALPLPLMLAELSLGSWETISRRTLLIAQRTCSPREYTRMVAENVAATSETAAVTIYGLPARDACRADDPAGRRTCQIY